MMKLLLAVTIIYTVSALVSELTEGKWSDIAFLWAIASGTFAIFIAIMLLLGI